MPFRECDPQKGRATLLCGFWSEHGGTRASGMTKRLVRLSGATLALGASATLVACVDSNHRTTIGEDVRPMAFQESPGTMRQNDGPSLVSVGRTEWAAIEYSVPVDGVGHRPNYRTHWLTDQSSARKRGEFPTATTAFDLGKSGDWSQTEEVLIAPVNQMFDALMIPVLLFKEPQTLEMRSPYRHFERTPKGSVMPVVNQCCDESYEGCDQCQACDAADVAADPPAEATPQNQAEEPAERSER